MRRPHVGAADELWHVCHENCRGFRGGRKAEQVEPANLQASVRLMRREAADCAGGESTGEPARTAWLRAGSPSSDWNYHHHE